MFPDPGPRSCVLCRAGRTDDHAGAGGRFWLSRQGCLRRPWPAGVGRAKEAEVVEAGARTLGATFEAVAVKVEPGADLEARARLARYEALPEGALVGHTADDQAETLLLNLVRGAGIDGLSGMRVRPPARVRSGGPSWT